MKKLLSICIYALLIAFQSVHAQNFRWAKGFASNALDEGRGIVFDDVGNSYITGIFNGNLDFDPNAGTFNLTSAGVEDVFILKLNSRGELVWAKQIGGTGSDKGFSIAMSSTGELHVTGTFQGTVDFDPNAGIANLTSAGGTDIFITKLDTSGNLIWAKPFGGTSDDEGKSVTVGLNGNVYATGFFQATADFDPDAGTVNLVSTALKDIFFLKLNASGALVWAKKIGGSDNDEGLDIAVDSLGNIYSTGIYWYTVDFDPGPATYNLSGGAELFINKLDSSGNFVWANGYGGQGFDVGSAITLDAAGNVLATGYFFMTVDFDAGAGLNNLTSVGLNDAFIINLDAASGGLVWVKQVGGSGAAGIEPRGLYVNSAGQFLITGYFNSTVDFDPSAATSTLTTVGAQDIFIAQYDASGNLIWANQFGGGGGKEGYDITADDAGNIVTTGWFSQTVDFDPGAGVANLPYATSRDVYVVKLSQSAFYSIQGNVFADMNSNCSRDSTEFGLQNILVKAEPGPVYGATDNAGNYNIYLLNTGNYNVSVATQDSLWQPSCTTALSVQVTSADDTISGNDFTLEASSYCPRMSVELGTSRLRRCVNSTYSISYRNTGTLEAVNAFVNVDFGGYLIPQSSTLPWSTVAGTVYTFPLGDIDMNKSGAFQVTVLLDCATQPGSTQCVTAHIYPDSLCLPTPAGWDKSETAVSGACVNDSLVCFTIKNRSSAGGGDMNGAAQWRLYVNDTLVTQGTYQLAGSDSIIKCFPANGKTYRLEADQNLPHQRRSKPQAIVEACGSPTSFGFVNTVPQDDEELAVETFCMTVTGSFDPNDKQVSPIGITSNNYITADDELEYLIRFQNTGTDTAFKVVIRDTIATDVLDIVTLASGASSHDYTFNIYGQGIAEWTFDNILLPDSFVNESASHGFVQFKIKQLPGNASGTRIENRVGIYFDFNDPVITNTVWNEVHEDSSFPVSLFSAVVDSVIDIITCHGDSTGTASVSATGGLPPYQFAWSNGATDAAASNLFAGNYFITVTDAAENSWTDSVNIAEPTLLEAAITSQTNVLCFGDGTGTATAAAIGGTTPYTYEWSNTSGFQTATSLNAGVYSVTVWDAHLCTATTSSVTITEPTQLTTLISTQSGVTCFGGNDAAAKANPGGGVSPYAALWSDGQTDFTANDLSAGNYQVTVTDSNGCQLITSITIQDGYQVPAGTIAGADSADINQTETYNVNAGLSYTWSVTNGTILSGQGTNSIEVDWNAIGQGVMEVAVTDSGCTETVSKTIALVDPTGIEDDLLNAMELYPNPTNGTIILKQIPSLEGMESVNMKLYDSIGKQVLQQTATPLELQQGILLDLNELQEGIFFLNIKTGEGTRVMKVVKY